MTERTEELLDEALDLLWVAYLIGEWAPGALEAWKREVGALLSETGDVSAQAIERGISEQTKEV